MLVIRVLLAVILFTVCGFNWEKGCYHPFCKRCTCMEITRHWEPSVYIGNNGLGPDCNKTQWKDQPRKHWLLQMPLSSPSHIPISLHLTRRPEGFVSSAFWFAPRGDLVCSPQCSIYSLRFSSQPSAAPEQRAICLPRANKQEKNSAAATPAAGPAALFIPPMYKLGRVGKKGQE